MRNLGNILWHFPFLGFVNAIFCFLLGGILVVTVIGAPIGQGLIQLGTFMLTPFTKAMISKNDLGIEQNKGWKAYGTIVRIIYFPFGLFLAIAAIFQIAGMFLSIVGIPVALVLAKSLGTYINPVGKKCVPRAVGVALEEKKAQEAVQKYTA